MNFLSEQRKIKNIPHRHVITLALWNPAFIIPSYCDGWELCCNAISLQGVPKWELSDGAPVGTLEDL